MLTRNPFYKKIQVANGGEAVASYGGIALRCLWYWMLCAVGIAAFIFVPLETIPPALLLGGACIALICPLLTYWIPQTASIAGSVYSVVLGFLVAMICSEYAKEFTGIVYLALGITALVFFVALMLYRSGIIKVNHKFRGVLLTLFLASIAGSTLVYMSSFFTTVFTDVFYGNGSLAIIVSILSLLIASMNLVFEFDFATSLVNRKIQKKYEWIAAYGLFMTVIFIFIRTLNLLAKIMPAKES